LATEDPRILAHPACAPHRRLRSKELAETYLARRHASRGDRQCRPLTLRIISVRHGSSHLVPIRGSAWPCGACGSVVLASSTYAPLPRPVCVPLPGSRGRRRHRQSGTVCSRHAGDRLHRCGFVMAFWTFNIADAGITIGAATADRRVIARESAR